MSGSLDDVQGTESEREEARKNPAKPCTDVFRTRCIAQAQAEIVRLLAKAILIRFNRTEEKQPVE